mgnify:CR=1 FL=1
MSEEASGGKVDNELADRLDTLFDEDAEEPAVQSGETDDPLDELKSLVMSIEWEITDDLMERFVAQVETLKSRYKDDRLLVMFLQLLGSLGLYVKSNKGKAHPSAFGLLNSVYASFAKAAMPGKISSSEKKKLLYVELNKYKELKEQIGFSRDAGKEAPLAPKFPATEAAARQDPSNATTEGHGDFFDEAPAQSVGGVTPQQFEAAIQDLKRHIRDEFQKLREALLDAENS